MIAQTTGKRMGLEHRYAGRVIGGNENVAKLNNMGALHAAKNVDFTQGGDGKAFLISTIVRRTFFFRSIK